MIAAIGPASNLSRDEGSLIDDFSHCTIVPALIDCSVSLLQTPSLERSASTSPENDKADLKALLDKHINYCHIHGVLGVADNDDIPALPARQGPETGPEALITIKTPGADFLRIMYSPDIGEESPANPRPSYDDLCRTLQNRGKTKAIVVVNGPQQTAEALAAGCDAIEQGYGMGGDNLRTMADNHVLWIPGVIRARNGLDGASGGGAVCCRFSTRYVAPGKPLPGAEAFWKKMLAEQLEQLRLARKLGVATAVGTGAGSVGILHGESVTEEMKLFIKAGYSREETIKCASENGAHFFGFNNLGALAAGKQATFLVTRGTVQQLPRKLAYLESVYINGKPSPVYRKIPGGGT